MDFNRVQNHKSIRKIHHSALKASQSFSRQRTPASCKVRIQSPKLWRGIQGIADGGWCCACKTRCMGGAVWKVPGSNMLRTMLHIGLVQERRNSSALAMELRLSCTKPSISRRFELCPAAAHSCAYTLSVSIQKRCLHENSVTVSARYTSLSTLKSVVSRLFPCMSLGLRLFLQRSC